MTNVTKAVLINERKKKFGDLDPAILENMNGDGVVYYHLNAKGERVYGLPKGPRTSDSPPLISEVFTGPGQVQQQFRDDCDINVVLRKYGAHTDYIPQDVQIPIEYFRDLSLQPTDLTEALEVVEEAREMFSELPAAVRRHVNDDPVKFLELSQTPEGVKIINELMNPPKQAPEAFPNAVEPQEAKPPKNASKAKRDASDEE